MDPTTLQGCPPRAMLLHTESMAHDWHTLDEERGYDVRQLDDGSYEVRDPEGAVTPLTSEEFEQLRVEGPNPKGLY